MKLGDGDGEIDDDAMMLDGEVKETPGSIGHYLKITFNKLSDMLIFERKNKDEMVDEKDGKKMEPGYKEGLNLLIHEAMKDKSSFRRFVNRVG